jgi:hypothetical protein
MEAVTQTFHSIEPKYPAITTIETTLYELIEAVSDEVKSGEDDLVALTMLHLLDTGHIKFIGADCDVKSI